MTQIPSMPRILLVLAAILAATTIGRPVLGQSLVAKWTSPVAPPGVTPGNFGNALDIDGDLLAVGARYTSIGGFSSGAVYMYRYHEGFGWVQEAAIEPLEVSDGGAFGSDVALEGDTLVIGANSDATDGPNVGSSFVFIRDGTGQWQELQRLTAPAGAFRFGTTVDISGDIIAIGATEDDRVAESAGAVVLFERDHTGFWSQTDDILNPIAETYSWFGSSLCLDGERLFVRDSELPPRGAVRVFERNPDSTWSPGQILQESDPASRASFGGAIDVSDGRVFIGATRAFNTPEQTTTAGAVYVFQEDALGMLVEILKIGSPGASARGFGHDIDAEGDRVLISYMQHNYIGQMHLFEFYGAIWQERGPIYRPDGTWDDFGEEVALHERYLIGSDAGISVQLFDSNQSSQIGVLPEGLPDFNGDGFVDGFDLAVLLAGWTP